MVSRRCLAHSMALSHVVTWRLRRRYLVATSVQGRAKVRCLHCPVRTACAQAREVCIEMMASAMSIWLFCVRLLKEQARRDTDRGVHPVPPKLRIFPTYHHSGQHVMACSMAMRLRGPFTASWRVGPHTQRVRA
jgi:hypothetical protein